MKKPQKSLPSFDLEMAIVKWSRDMKHLGLLEEGTTAELQAHLRDEIDDLVEQGKSPEDAFNEVTASVERAETIGQEFYKTFSRGLFVVPPQRHAGLSPAILLNSLKVSFRKMRQQKWYAAISIAGLAVGIACTLSILLWTRNELAYDRFHANDENIYRVIMEDHLNDGVSVHPWLPFPLGPALENEFPEIAAVSRYRPDNMVVRYKDSAYTETEFLTVDPSFFRIFSFPFLHGNPSEALAAPNSIVIRDTMVPKYFGKEDPLGKVLNLSGRADLAVSGVVHIPEESDFQFDFFFSFQSYPLFHVDMAPLEANWDGKNYQVYLRVHRAVSATQLEEKIAGFLKPFRPAKTEVLRLQRLSRIHLYNPDGSDGAMRYVRIFALIGFFILLIACVNFMNLATARYEGRTKEVSLRKTLGGTRGQLMRQFFGESLLHSVLAMALALILVEIALPAFNQITSRRLSLDLAHADIVLCLLAIVLLAGFISGLYPSLFLSSFPPARLFKSSAHPRGHGALFRKTLVISQFALSTVLIIGTLVVNSQISFIMNRDTGIAKENIVYHLMQSKTRDSVAVVREELLKHPDILGITSCSSLPSEIQSWIGYIDWEGRSAEQMIYPAFLSIDEDFIGTVGLKVIAGRGFSKYRPADKGHFIINRTASHQIGLKNPIGLELRFWGQRGQVIGVVDDFTNRHMSSATAPMVLSSGNWGANRNYLLLRLRPGNPSSALEHFRQVWAKANPGFPCEYEFLDDEFDRMYTNEQRLSRILFSFTILAVFISCLGLVGLSSYTAEKKTKEIGIRRVLGASPWKILSLFSLNIAKFVIIANGIAWPIAYLIMHRWLQDYAYRTTIGLWIFILSGSLGLFIAFLSVGYQTFRAATADPARSLRYE